MSDVLFDKIKRQMRDLIYGRTIAPTLAEAAKHSGLWLVHDVDVRNAYFVDIIGGRVRCDGHSWPLAEFVDANHGAVWRPINAERAIVAWPEVTP